MEERTIHLKIKIKSLADEAKSIRKEARKTSGMTKWNLNHHRTEVVRPHARHNLLAYGLIRKVPYAAIEQYTVKPPEWSKIEKLARRFGADTNDITNWIFEAKSYVKHGRQPERLSA